MPQSSRYGEVVLLAGVAFVTVWNYLMTVDTFALPHKTSLYSLKPIFQHDQYLSAPSASESSTQGDEFHRTLFDAKYTPTGVSGDFNFHYMNPAQVAKYVLGCYGNANFSDFQQTDTNSWFLSVEAPWKAGKVAEAKVNATKFLNTHQILARADAKSNNGGVCACIDNVVRQTWNKVATPYTTVHPDGPDMSGNLYDLKLLGFESEDAVTDGEFYSRTVEFCQQSAVPMFAIQYEGTIGIPVLLLVAQMVILLGLLHAWDVYVDKDENSMESSDEKVEKNPHVVRRYSKVTFAIAIFVGYMYLASRDSNQFGNDNPQYQGFRMSGRTQAAWTSTNTVVVVLLVLMLIIEFVFEYTSANAYAATGARDPSNGGAGRRSDLVSCMVDRVGADVPFIIGFALLGMCVMLQADVTNSTSVIGGVFILLTAGLLQHISNLAKILYESICFRLDAKLVASLTLLEDNERVPVNPNVRGFLNTTEQPAHAEIALRHKTRKLLQFFGWSRLYLFITVVSLSIAFFTIARDTSHVYVVKNILDGQLLLFVFAFLFANIGFDMMYELMPFAFEKVHSDTLRLYFIVAYLLLFNFNQLTYMRSMHFTGV